MNPPNPQPARPPTRRQRARRAQLPPLPPPTRCRPPPRRARRRRQPRPAGEGERGTLSPSGGASRLRLPTTAPVPPRAEAAAARRSKRRRRGSWPCHRRSGRWSGRTWTLARPSLPSSECSDCFFVVICGSRVGCAVWWSTSVCLRLLSSLVHVLEKLAFAESLV